MPFVFHRGQRLLYVGGVLLFTAALAVLQIDNDNRPQPRPHSGAFHPANHDAQQPDNAPDDFDPFNDMESDMDPTTDPSMNPNMRPNRPLNGPPPRHFPPFLTFMVIGILVVGFDTGVSLAVKWVKSEQDRVTAEKENVETKLAFLRNQISPHFFMNTLNNIHALIDFDSEQAKESIIKLSKLMRHLLYDSQAETIALPKEVEFIAHYVELMKIRSSERIRIECELPAQLPNKAIPPLLFTSFVENAFKYGISYQRQSYINIQVSVVDEQLLFEVRNSNHPKGEQTSQSGIGIANTRKRLDLIFGNKYVLVINDQPDEFTVKLTIPL